MPHLKVNDVDLYYELHGAGHASFWESAAEFNRVLVEFLHEA